MLSMQQEISHMVELVMQMHEKQRNSKGSSKRKRIAELEKQVYQLS
jgi:hypothetical protein